jgi:major membrane immunogen (membrane-anchored lipoprotein)
MDTQKKLLVALGVLLLLGGALFAQNQKHAADAQAHSLEGQQGSLPKIEIAEDKLKDVDRVVLDKPPATGAGQRVTIELKKQGEDAWQLAAPVTAKANAANVKSMIESLPKLKLTEQISANKAEYDQWGVSDEKALHATFYKGDEKVADLYFGEDGSRGQMTRLADKDGVYTVSGFSKWLFERDASGWRDKTMFKFDDKEVVKVSIDNKHGAFRFEKSGDAWSGKHGKTAAALTPIKDFQSSKIDDLLRAYKSLSAMDFGDGKQPAEVGLDKPEGTISIELKGGSGLHVLKVSSTGEGSNRWASTNSSDVVYAVSSWSAGWATAEPSKFQKGDEKAAAPGGDPHAGGLPGLSDDPE